MSDRKPRPSKVQGTVKATEPPVTLPTTALVRSPDGRPYWERNAEHPGGEVWVAGHGSEPSGAVRVALTDGVRRAIREGRLTRVGEAGDGAKLE